MTALIMDNLTALPTWRHFIATIVWRAGRSIDRAVRAHAQRHVPAWRMRPIQQEIVRYQSMVARPQKSNDTKTVGATIAPPRREPQRKTDETRFRRGPEPRRHSPAGEVLAMLALFALLLAGVAIRVWIYTPGLFK